MNVFPKQKVKTSEKLKINKGDDFPQWGKDNMDFLIDNIGSDYEKLEMQSLMRVAEGYIDQELYSYVLNPYNTDTGKNRNFPARLRNYDIISPVIYSFLGEKSKKPNNFQVVAVNEDAPNMFTEKLHGEMSKLLNQQFINNLNELGVDTGMQSKEGTPSAQDFYKEFATSYSDARAIKGQESLNILKYDLDIKDKMQTAFYYWLVLGRVITYKDVHRNDVSYDVVHPIEMTYSKSPNLPYIEDGNWALRKFKMNVNDVIDRWRDDLDDKTIDLLENLGDSLHNSEINHFNEIATNSQFNHDSDGLLDVYHGTWKSFKLIGILKYSDELGIEREKEVDEKYKIDKSIGDLSIKWEWINEVWECWRIDESIYLDCRPIKVQRDEMNNSSVCKLPYNGRTWFSETNNIKSVLKEGIDYQTLYNIYHYRAEMTMARNKDKLLMMPMGILPKEWGDDAMENFMYYAEATGIGWIDESRPGAMAALQSIKAVDLSLSQYFSAMYEAMQAIKQEWWDSVGMNRQRYGDTKASDGKGVNEQAIFRSSVITEELFRQFGKFEEKDLNGLLDYSKLAWIDGKRGSYIGSDGRAELYDVDSLQHMESQYGIFAKDQSDENEKLETMKSIALTFAQNGSKPGLISEIIDSSNFSQTKTHLANLDKMEDERLKAEQKAEQESNERIQQMVNENDEKNREAAKYKVDMDYKRHIDGKKIDAKLAINLKDDIAPVDDTLDYLKESNQNATNREQMQRTSDLENKKLDIEREGMRSAENIARENKNKHDK